MRRLRIMALVVPAAAFVALACGSVRRAVAVTPTLVLSPAEQATAGSDAKAVFERRCVVCHGCYDAPCQLKLGTFDGIDRGASNAKVYEASRLLPAEPTRLDIDAHDALGWRRKGFHPVLPEGVVADPRASLLLRMLELQRGHP